MIYTTNMTPIEGHSLVPLTIMDDRRVSLEDKFFYILILNRMHDDAFLVGQHEKMDRAKTQKALNRLDSLRYISQVKVDGEPESSIFVFWEPENNFIKRGTIVDKSGLEELVATISSIREQPEEGEEKTRDRIEASQMPRVVHVDEEEWDEEPPLHAAIRKAVDHCSPRIPK